MRLILGTVLAALLLGIGVAGIVERPVWAADGFTYSMMAQMDRGVSYANAHAATEEAYHVQRPPEWWRLFSIRVLYPWIASLLWHPFAFRSLFIVSAISYAIAGVLLYALLLGVARPALAATVALATMMTHEPLLLARSNLTDMTAFAALVWTMFAAVRYARSNSRTDFAWFIAASVILTITRPVPYLPLLIAAPFLFSAARTQAVRMIVVSGLLCLAVGLVFLAVHPEPVALGDYREAFAVTMAHALASFAISIVAPVSLVVLAASRRQPIALAALGLFASTLPTIVVDPLPLDLDRVVFLPAAISFACGLTIALEASVRAARGANGHARPVPINTAYRSISAEDGTPARN